ncbi:hypothetical protein [Halospeciosus flavus]|uniref:Small CPxCG-related zinc finger protein n=1 Tax=Halospeciosus flavus TaxID=3032283 RepID=A0ABD5Z617_9EURY|nr:hypothetical protein [Halospeciosus flavus]
MVSAIRAQCRGCGRTWAYDQLDKTSSYGQTNIHCPQCFERMGLVG